jgi:Flp pilus assembly protein TadG
MTELAVALPILLLLLVGMVEAVALANSHLRLQATVREGARFGSHAAVPATAQGAAQIREVVLSQMEADGLVVANPDQDIVVVFAKLDPQSKSPIARVQYPSSSNACPTDLSTKELMARASAGKGLASTMLVAVEVCFQHAQVLGLPIVSDLLPDPVPIHLHTVMPRTWP